MKTFRSKPKFIAKPPAKVQAMAKKYGTLEIAKKESYGPNLLKEGYGTFDTYGIESWQTQGNNLISNTPANEELQGTYVDNSTVLETYITTSRDLAEPLNNATYYLVTFNIRTDENVVTIQINDGDTNPNTTISNTDNETYYLTIQMIGTNPKVILAGTSVVINLNWWKVQEVL